MNWINTLTWPQWLLMAAIPPAIISLYFLKLKRKPIEVPSTLLWRRALEDLHVNSVWQRLKKNILLLLQLLFILFGILALLRPGWQGTESVGERRIYIIDNSASMQTIDGDTSRLATAKARIKDLISQTTSNDVGMVIAFSDRADVRQGFTKDKSKLLAAIESVGPTNHTTDLSEALRAAAGLANPGRSSFDDMNDIQVADAIPATVYLLSDGAFGDLPEMELGQLRVEYVPIGEPETDNLAIVSFAVQRSDDKSNRLEAFARIANFGKEKVSCTASLEILGELGDANALEVEPGKEAGLLFDLEQLEEGTLKLTLDHTDALMLDNVAYAAVRPAQTISVLLVTDGNSALESALQTERCKRISEVRVETPDFLDSEAYAKADREFGFDLIVFDRCSPKAMPNANTLFFGSIPPGAVAKQTDSAAIGSANVETGGTESSPTSPSSGSPAENTWRFGPTTGPMIVLDVNRSNPITQYLEMASVTIIEGHSIEPPAGGTLLLTSDEGPLFAVAPRGPFQDAVLGFGLLQNSDKGTLINSDWGIKRSFPVFCYSAIENLGGGITEASAPSVQPGQAIGLSLSTRRDNYRVESPDGAVTSLERNEESRITFTQTDALGAYRVYSGDNPDPVETFCVNLFSPQESKLDVASSVELGGEKIDASNTSIRARQETWRWLLVLALVVLMAEWMIFNRRIFA